MDLLKFISNKKILSGVVVIGYNQLCSQTLPISLYAQVCIQVEHVPKAQVEYFVSWVVIG